MLKRLDNMSSFKGRYNDTIAAAVEFPPDPPEENVTPEEDGDKNSLLSPIVSFATSDTISTTSTSNSK